MIKPVCKWVSYNGKKLHNPTYLKLLHYWKQLGGVYRPKAPKEGVVARDVLEQYYLNNFRCGKYDTMNLGVRYLPESLNDNARARLLLTDIALLKRGNYSYE